MDDIAHGEKPEAVVERHPAATSMFCTVHRYELDHLEAERDELLAALNQHRGAVEDVERLQAALRAVLDKHGDECGVCVEAEQAIPSTTLGGMMGA